MEKRKHRKGRPGRAGLVLLCALLLAGCVTAAILLRKNAEVETPAQRQRVTGAVTRRSQEEFQSLTIIPREGEPWTAVREADGSLRIRKPDGAERNLRFRSTLKTEQNENGSYAGIMREDGRKSQR